jgi:hypothetical protein
MKSSNVRKAVILFRTPNTPKAVRHHNIRAWLRAQAILGDNHVYAKKVQRQGKNNIGTLHRFAFEQQAA